MFVTFHLDLSEFLKPLDARTAEVLARALTDDSELSESDESLLAHELPSFSRPSSLDGDRGLFNHKYKIYLHILTAYPLRGFLHVFSNPLSNKTLSCNMKFNQPG